MVWAQSQVSDWSNDIVAGDCKTTCCALDKANGKAAVHLVGAFFVHNRLISGQVKIDDKLNEITVISEFDGTLCYFDWCGCYP